MQIFSRFIDGLVDDLESVYGDSALTSPDKVERRQRIFDFHLDRFRTEVRPRLASLTFGGFDALPLNNATLLSRMRYYHRLPDFDGLLEESGGSLREAVAALQDGLPDVEDPFSLLPQGRGGPAGGPRATRPSAASRPLPDCKSAPPFFSFEVWPITRADRGDAPPLRTHPSMPSNADKAYDAAAVEHRWQARWGPRRGPTASR